MVEFRPVERRVLMLEVSVTTTTTTTTGTISSETLTALPEDPLGGQTTL